MGRQGPEADQDGLMARSIYPKRQLAFLEELLSEIPLSDWDHPPMSLSELNGFLTAILVSPDLVTPSHWLPHIWGGGESLPIPDQAVAQMLVDAVMEHYNIIAGELHHGRKVTPIYEEDMNSGETLWEPWVSGFELGMQLAPGGWTRILDSADEEASASVRLILMLHHIDIGESDLTEGQIDEMDERALALLPQAVASINDWRRQRDPFALRVGSATPDAAGLTRRDNVIAFPGTGHSSKACRNEHCPCGSGRKYKHCCGAH